MKLQNAKNKRNSFLLLCLFATGIQLYSKNISPGTIPKDSIQGVWVYVSITRNDTTVFPVSASDTMKLDPTGTFRYDLEIPGKHATGMWRTMDSAGYNYLVLTYQPAGNSRYFRITTSTADSLVFDEQGIKFVYRRKL